MSEFKPFYKIDKSEIFKRNVPRVKVTRPRILKIISDENGEWMTAKSLKYFKIPHPSDFPLDLNAGYEEYQIRHDELFKPNLCKLESYIIGNEKSNVFQDPQKHHIVTARHVLKYLMNTPYYKNNNWSIKATKFGNVIYIIRWEFEQRVKLERGTHHFKFLQYCLSDSPNCKPKTDEPVDESKRVFGLFRNTIDEFEILYSAEVVGVEAKEEVKDLGNEEVLNKCKYVATKLLWEKSFEYCPEWRRNRLLVGTWTQSYLGCVPNIYVGFKTDNGYMNKNIERVKTDSFPKNQNWSPEICKRFLRDMLRKIECLMDNVDCPYTVFEFNFDSKQRMIKYRVFESKSEHSFLSENFIRHMRENYISN